MARSQEAEDIGQRTRVRLAGFVRALRDNSLRVGLAETHDAALLLASPIARRPATLRPALRALFCGTRADWSRFDAIFDAYWLRRGVRSAVRASDHSPKSLDIRRLAEGLASHSRQRAADPERRQGSDDGSSSDSREWRDAASRAEALARTDLRKVGDPEDIRRIHALTARLARKMRTRLLRRQRMKARGPRLDLRRTIHRSISHGGAPIDLAWRRRKTRPLRLVVLLDASGSMSVYTPLFVRFLHGVLDAFADSEAFIFHTRLAHVSPSLRERDMARALDRLSLMAQGIGGGTRIGESLATFNRWHAARVINSRTAIIIVSDGYDTGEPERLAAEMGQLRRRCRRIVWLNPLIGWRDYAPVARGMQAALPYVDLFAPAHNLESLAALEPYLARL